MIVDNVCKTCANYVAGRTCLAFLKEIPDDIWYGENDHKKNVKGDHGVKYEKNEDIIISKQ